MPQVGFEPTISAGERPQTYALDRAAIGKSKYDIIESKDGFFLPSPFSKLISHPKTIIRG